MKFVDAELIEIMKEAANQHPRISPASKRENLASNQG
jgi:hypothetical protein